MPQYQFVVLVCAGLLAILGAVKIVTEAILKKDSTEVKRPCHEKFKENSDNIATIEREAAARKDRILKLEMNYGYILEKIAIIETEIKGLNETSIKNAEMTRQIYAWIDKRKTNGKRK